MANATATKKKADAPAAGGVGRIARVTGSVVDIEFPHDAIPEMYNALKTTITIGDESNEITLEVAQHLGDDLVRAIALKPTDGLVRGQEVRDTGSAISVPVGDVLDALLPVYIESRIFNAMLQSAAAKHAATQKAMKSASDNADKLITTYTRLANNARQSEITQQISEIVGGADALSSAK